MPLSAPVALSETHDLSGFDCGDHALNDWLKHRALKNESRFSRTYVVCSGRAVVAYFCISAGGIERSQAPSKLRRNAPDQIPVSIVGRLAVCRSQQGRGLGSSLLGEALRRVAIASQTIGIGAALIQAKGDEAKEFYLSRAEFIEFPSDSRTLYLPIETLLAAFS